MSCDTTTQGHSSFQKVKLCRSSLLSPKSVRLASHREVKSRKKEHLVRAAGRQLGMRKEFESHIALGNVSSGRQTGLKKQTRLGRVGQFDTVDLDTDVARRLTDVYSLDSNITPSATSYDDAVRTL